MLSKRILLQVLPLLLAAAIAHPNPCLGQQAPKPGEKAAPKTPPAQAVPAEEPSQNADAKAEAAEKTALPQGEVEKLESPAPIPPAELVPNLKTITVRHDKPSFNTQMVNTAKLPRDKEGIWILDFAFKPLRIRTVEIPGKGRRPVHYLYYRVVNRTGKPRMFVPQFVMVNEEGKKFEDQVIPQVLPLIQAREDATIPVLGAVNIMGTIPPSTKEGVDDAVFGAAVWDNWDAKSDRFSIYVRGLSDGYKEIPDPKGGKPTVKYKTLRIDFIRRGDERNISEKEIELSDPPYEWVYW
jgi:hypothetical protein